MVRECKRKNRPYQRHALVSFKVFADTFSDRVDVLKQAQPFLTELCEMDEDEVAEDDENDNAKPLLLMIKANAFKTLIASFRPRIFIEHREYLKMERSHHHQIREWDKQKKRLSYLFVFFLIISEEQTEAICQTLIDSLKGNVWNVQLAILDSLKLFFERVDSHHVNDALLNHVLDTCSTHGLNDLKYSAIRTATNDVLDALVASCKCKFILFLYAYNRRK